MIKKSCSIVAALWLAVFAAYYFFLRSRVEWPGDAFLALFGSIGLLILVSSLWQVIFGTGDQGALARAEKGLPLVDGEKEAVWGPIVPSGKPLLAPFSGKECVAYEYDVKRQGGSSDEETTSSEVSGWAFAPSVIRSNRGEVRLSGFGLLTEFEEASYQDDAQARERAEAFIAGTQFEQMGLLKLGKMVSEMDGALAGEEGSTRRDWKIAKGEVHAAGNRLLEKIVAVGENVTAVGVYDATRYGLVPKYKGKTAPINIKPGFGAAMVMEASKRPWGILVFSLIWSGFAHAFIYLAVTRN